MLRPICRPPFNDLFEPANWIVAGQVHCPNPCGCHSERRPKSRELPMRMETLTGYHVAPGSGEVFTRCPSLSKKKPGVCASAANTRHPNYSQFVKWLRTSQHINIRASQPIRCEGCKIIQVEDAVRYADRSGYIAGDRSGTKFNTGCLRVQLCHH